MPVSCHRVVKTLNSADPGQDTQSHRQAWLCRAVMGLPRWKRTGGRDFVFYHSHPGFEWDDLDVTTAYQETICNDFQAGLSGFQAPA